MNQHICLLGLNHRTAPVEVRERYALPDPDPREQGLITAQSGVKEAMILSTCNRVEFLAVGRADKDLAKEILHFWAETRNGDVHELQKHTYTHQNLNAVTHLFSVASSLDSMILGEPQILGQLKQAYRRSLKQGAAGVVLNRLLHKSFSVAKRVRTETKVASNAVSISFAAVELAKRIFGDLGDQTAMLVGAGEMAELAAQHLLSAGVKRMLIANRTHVRGCELASRISGEAVLFSDLFERMAEADIVISSTGATQTVIRRRDVQSIMKQRRNRPMFFIDIAVPRDIDPDVNSLDNIFLYDIDDLKEVVEENLSQRKSEAAKAMVLVEEETEKFALWLRSLDLKPTILDLLSSGEHIARKELKKTLRRLGPKADDPEINEALETLVLSLAHKLYHQPLDFLKRRAQEEDAGARYIDITRRMFNLDNEPPMPDAHPDRRCVGKKDQG
ncbi:glutamyl-tRNA reductase [Desulfonatronum thiosulfatophilum]|uniref:Glutamyl-tRNA reductase n=1 Tax=Desulfonatronum thiosulfatophilum TaxID=617002 RepID=A0A1G6ESS1_9BACT|nr:glutamyl-tRNA reductase [Desulfonatronum thiosulfatophilum]SDB60433.1 glutamyl-tRNA reductase [Desulfonatronum thiosulfatophilum]